jgi:hypothetical protein
MENMKESLVHSEKSEPRTLPRLAYTMREAAAMLGISYISVHRLLKRGLLRSSTALRHKVIPATELERFLKSTLN